MAMQGSSPQRRVFADLVSQADSQIDLARAALVIAQDEYAALDVERYLARLGELAGAVRARLADQAGGLVGLTRTTPVLAGPQAVIAALNVVLFEEQGFHDNQADYYDPRNSFLNDVLDRRTGIPISIALVYMEVAARVGLPLLGIGVPGHFIVKYAGTGRDTGGTLHDRPPDELFIDPYHAGALLTRADCAAYFRRLYGPDFTFSAEYLTPYTRHQILARMLNNLKAIYLRRRDYRRAVVVVDRLLLVQPDALWELKDRGMLHYRLGAFRAALADLRRFLKQDPDAEDAPLIRYYVKQCRRLLMIAN